MKSSSNPSPEPPLRFGREERDFVLKVAMKLLKNQDDAEDAAQDAMLQAFRHRDSFRGDTKFEAWLYRVAVTASLMHLRKQRREARARVGDRLQHARSHVAIEGTAGEGGMMEVNALG